MLLYGMLLFILRDADTVVPLIPTRLIFCARICFTLKLPHSGRHHPTSMQVPTVIYWRQEPCRPLRGRVWMYLLYPKISTWR